MKTLIVEQIKEIAEMLDCGFCCFWNKQTSELIFIPDFSNNISTDKEFYTEEIEKLENNFDDYIEIKRPQSKDSFSIMENFTEQLDDKIELKNKLINALNTKKPFREFKFVIDNSGDYRDQWFEFKNSQFRKWVSDKFNEITSDE